MKRIYVKNRLPQNSNLPLLKSVPYTFSESFHISRNVVELVVVVVTIILGDLRSD